MTITLIILIVCISAGVVSILYLTYEVKNTSTTPRRFTEAAGKLSSNLRRGTDEKQVAKDLYEVLNSFTFTQYSANAELRQQLDALLEAVSSKIKDIKSARHFSGAEIKDLVQVADRILEKEFARFDALQALLSKAKPLPAANPVSLQTLREMRDLYPSIMLALLRVARDKGIPYRGSEELGSFLNTVYQGGALLPDVYKFFSAALKVMETDADYVESHEGEAAVKLAEAGLSMLPPEEEDKAEQVAVEETSSGAAGTEERKRAIAEIFSRLDEISYPNPFSVNESVEGTSHPSAKHSVTEQTQNRIGSYYSKVMRILLKTAQKEGIEYEGKDTPDELLWKLYSRLAISSLAHKYLTTALKIVIAASRTPEYVEEADVTRAFQLADEGLKLLLQSETTPVSRREAFQSHQSKGKADSFKTMEADAKHE